MHTGGLVALATTLQVKAQGWSFCRETQRRTVGLENVARERWQQQQQGIQAKGWGEKMTGQISAQLTHVVCHEWHSSSTWRQVRGEKRRCNIIHLGDRIMQREKNQNLR